MTIKLTTSKVVNFRSTEFDKALHFACANKYRTVPHKNGANSIEKEEKMMMLSEKNRMLAAIHELFYQLGITAEFTGFFYAAYAVLLAAEQPEKLMFVTKWLYPEVAKHYNTTWQAVERGIRTVITIAWKTNRQGLCRFAGRELSGKPTPKQFIAILVAWLEGECAG